MAFESTARHYKMVYGSAASWHKGNSFKTLVGPLRIVTKRNKRDGSERVWTIMMKLFYENMYRYFKTPWDVGARQELVSLVDSGRIQPGRALDLGCGAGANAIYLAQHGFEVTGVDFAKAAIEKARMRAREASVHVNFIVDDLMNLRHVPETFDFLLDYGVLDDLRPGQRELYLLNLLPRTHLGSQYLLWGFEYPMRWWEKFVPFYDVPFYPGEVEQRFGQYFEIEKIASKVDYSKWPPGYAAYLMTRKGETT